MPKVPVHRLRGKARKFIADVTGKNIKRGEAAVSKAQKRSIKARDKYRTYNNPVGAGLTAPSRSARNRVLQRMYDRTRSRIDSAQVNLKRIKNKTLRRRLGVGGAGAGVLGTTGAAAKLRSEEREELINAVVETTLA